MKNEVIDKPATTEEQLKAKYPLACFLDSLISSLISAYKDSGEVFLIGAYAFIMKPFLHEEYKPVPSAWSNISALMVVSFPLAAIDKKVAIALSSFWTTVCIVRMILDSYEAYTRK